MTLIDAETGALYLYLVTITTGKDQLDIYSVIIPASNNYLNPFLATSLCFAGIQRAFECI